MNAILDVKSLRKTYTIREGWPVSRKRDLRVLDDVSFSVGRGEAMGVVGESGCGKSTTAKAILRLIDVDEGSATFDGVSLFDLSRSDMRKTRRRIQMVFQDSGSALSPRKRIGEALAEPIRVHGMATGDDVRRKVEAVLEEVGLPADSVRRYPHEFSGGQKQRIGIARALVLEPDLIVADEPVSALDVSVQAQILNLLKDIKERRGIAFVFISHDLGVVRHFCDRTAVMYLGRVIESGRSRDLFDNPHHPYTQLLRKVSPVPDPHEVAFAGTLEGEPPSPVDPPPGCHFHPRCPFATQLCRAERPPLRPMGVGREVACHHAEQIAAGNL